MNEAAFRVWLEVERGLNAGTVGSRTSNCRRVESHEGNLDAHYDSDELGGLLQSLNPGEPKHGIPIAGDVYNGTATLKNAVSLYRDFRRGGGLTVSSGDNSEKRQRRQGQSPRSRAQWPAWPQPKDEDLLDLARAMAPFVRFLNPGIVGAVVEDNRRFGERVVHLPGSARHRSRYLFLGGLALRISGGSAVCGKHRNCGVPETGRVQ